MATPSELTPDPNVAAAAAHTSGTAGHVREDDRRAPERTCVATRAVRPADELVRFVRGPDGSVAADLKRALPGRGVWVTATAEAVRLAVKKKAFARGFKEPVTVDPEIADQVDALIERATLGMLGFVNKAGLLVAGFAQVESALARETVVARGVAQEARDPGGRNLWQVLKRVGKSSDVSIVRLFRGEQLDLALGRSNVVHAALLAGPVSAAFLARCGMLAQYRGMSEGSGPAASARPTSIGSGDAPERTDRA